MRLPLALERRPDDLIVAVGLALILLVLVALLPDSWVRTFFGLIFVLVLPGYVTVAALFPSRERIDWIERIALTFGLSIAIVPLVGLALNFSPWGIELWPILVALTILVVGLSIIAYLRRMRLPIEERLRLDIEIDIDWKSMALIDKILAIGIVVVLLATVSVIVFAITNPPPGERFTQFALLDENHRAADYPTGPSGTVEICIGCNEDADTTYTLVIVLVEDTENFTSLTYFEQLPDSAQINIGSGIAVNISVLDDEWVNTTFSYQFLDIGEYKLRFLLYLQDEMEVVYREVYLWLLSE